MYGCLEKQIYLEKSKWRLSLGNKTENFKKRRLANLRNFKMSFLEISQTLEN